MFPVNLVSIVKWVINFDIILHPVYKTQIKSNLFQDGYHQPLIFLAWNVSH